MIVFSPLWLACGLLGGPADEPPRPTGGFIQLTPPWYRRVYDMPGTLEEKRRCLRALWQREFQNLRAIHFDTVIIQAAVSDDDVFFDQEVAIGGGLKPKPKDILDLSIPSIMEQAGADPQNLVAVWIGLRLRGEWNDNSWEKLVSNPGPVVGETVAVAKALKKSGLLDSERFAGWYITPEIDNARPGDIQATQAAGNGALKQIVAELKGIAAKPVAISGYFRPRKEGQSEKEFLKGHLSEPEFFKLLTATLDQTGITHFIFQDSMGVEDSLTVLKAHLKPDEIRALSGRYAGVQQAVGKGITTWADVELMIGECEGAPATNITRLADQLEGARACKKRVVFAASHHLTVLGGRLESDRLFKDFYRLVTTQPFQELPVQNCAPPR
jgi:Domain of unknown function (DUF4434)